jgi:ABC-type transport system involved in multi-copper enzyme maturation permease subunit
MMALALKELKSAFLDWRFLGTILISFMATLFITGVLIDSVSSFSEGNLFSAIPLSNKLVKIAVVENGPHPSIAELGKITTAYIVKTDLKNAQKMLLDGEVHAIYVVNETSGVFIGSNKPISVLAQLSVKEAIDKVVRAGNNNKYNFGDDTGLQDLVRGLLTPILLFSPVFVWGLPIIQSVAYDRENKVLEVLFSAPIDRKRILISKVLANMLFIAVVGAAWVGIIYAAGYKFLDPVGVYFVLLVVSFLMISMNALVSSISRNVQEATLASSISSTIIFTTLFLITMLKVFPYASFLADISPATFVARNITESSAFPLYPVLTLLVIAVSALILALSAFSTEAFAFSVKPGIRQLYEGMIEILGSGYKSAIGMGFVAFSLTTPVQLVLFAVLIFTLGANPLIIILGLALVEEFLKGTGTFVMKPVGLKRGMLIGALIGLSFGFGESLLLVPVLGASTAFRVVAISIHVFCSAVAGAGFGLENSDLGKRLPIPQKYLGIVGVVLATILHGGYNYLLFMSAVR